ncbi:tetratricopeptide (TPR) repeat protein [Mucilaginibacter lappiensis]|nr:O-antigen ligase family protein [Mucilaginibacter lappiensis]MBB6107673.1 tetratricopeptide (TPR) repeat protein [Mucilaginibacter lappiensis]
MTVIVLGLIYTPLVNNWNATPEVYYYFIGATFLSLCFLLTTIRNSEFRFNVIDVLLLFFLVYVFNYELLSHATLSFYLSDEFISVIAALCIYISFKQANKMLPGCLPYIIALTAIMELLWGMIQLSLMVLDHKFISGNITGSLGNSGVYAIYLACCLPCINHVFYLNKSTSYHKWIANGITTTVLILVLIDRSRTGLLLVIMTLWFMHKLTLVTIWDRSAKSKLFTKAFLYILVAGIITTLLCYKYPSFIGRLFIWKICFNMFLEKPFWGWGMSGLERNYLYHQAHYFKTHLISGQPYKYVAGQVINGISEYVMILVQFGLIGLSLFIYLAYRGYRTFVKETQLITWEALTLVLILLGSLFYYSLHVTSMLVLAMASLAGLALPLSFRINNRAFRYVAICVIICVFTVFLSYILSQYKATKIWRGASKMDQNQKNTSFDVKPLSDIHPELRHRSNFLYNYGAILFSVGNYNESVFILNECKFLHPSEEVLLYLGKAYEMRGDNNKAEACYIEASFMVPSKFYPKYLLVELYIKMGMIRRAVNLARMVLQMPIKVPSAETTVIISEMNRIINAYPIH